MVPTSLPIAGSNPSFPAVRPSVRPFKIRVFNAQLWNITEYCLYGFTCFCYGSFLNLAAFCWLKMVEFCARQHVCCRGRQHSTVIASQGSSGRTKDRPLHLSNPSHTKDLPLPKTKENRPATSTIYGVHVDKREHNVVPRTEE